MNGTIAGSLRKNYKKIGAPGRETDIGKGSITGESKIGTPDQGQDRVLQKSNRKNQRVHLNPSVKAGINNNGMIRFDEYLSKVRTST